ncbi:MAG: DNA methyltransferase [Planctomycetaceae bacterium]
MPDTALSPMIGSSGLFYRYNFTIEESTPLDIEVAVDPEMLGKVFEELVTERHESGAYYTPRPVVSFMCREALKGYLSHKTAASADSVATLVDNHQLNDLSETHAREILTALDGIKAVDPACGSGAYLLGLLHELVAIYRLLYSERLTRDSRSLYDLKLRIISHNLYGVDIDPFATNIAMLRLWLSLAVEANDPVPLPNLDFKIETGDSLLGSCDHPTKGSRTQGRLDWDDLRTKADALVEMKRRYFASHGTDKISHRDEIAKEESSIAQALRSFVGHGVIDWRIQFADAFIVNSGFDVVVANPPYVDSERMTANDPDYRAELGGRFTTTRGNWDLYIPFFERGFQLLNADGAMAFITPDKWSSKPFGEALRTLVFPYLSAIVNAGRNVFTSAAVDALVCIVSGDQLADVRVFSYENGNVRYKRRVAKSGLTKPYAFDGLFSDSIGFVERLGARSGRLSELGKCENACATSDAYKLKPFIKDAATEVLGDGYLKVVNTGTIGKYRSRWGKKPMTYLGDKLLRPVVKTSEWRRHFTNSYGRKAFAAKLIVKSLTLLDACMDEKGEVVPGKSTLIVTSRDPDDLYVLLGVINCPVSLFYLKQRYPGSSYNKGITFTKDMLNDLPIPRFSGDEKKALVRLVRARMAVDNDDGDKATKLERQIAMAVCSAFGLTEEDLSDIGADGMRS